MNWVKPSEDLAVSVAQDGDGMEDKCICCGAVIPEGIMVCPNCLVCRGYVQTNYERIIAMSPKELAEFICENTRECCDCVGFSLCVRDAGHANGLIKWLNKEVQHDGEE